MIFKSINPFSQEIITEYEILSDQALTIKLQLAETAFKTWKQTSFVERADKMIKLASILRFQKERLAQLITLEMGKVYEESLAEIEKSALNCEYYAAKAEQMLQSIAHETVYNSYTMYDPMGAVFAIMPWNYPFWQVLRYAAPVIMSGNITLLKHAPNVVGCAQAIEDIFLEAGFPQGVFQQLNIDIPQVESIIASNIVCGVTLTGSEMAGSSVGALAGKHIKKAVMELGGSDALIVLNDADIEQAATIAVQSRMLNAGQACICAKRFIVTDSIADDFVALLSHKISGLTQGNPMQKGIFMGPLARLDLADNLALQLEKSVEQGAKLIVGGSRDGCNFQPTLIDNVPEDSVAFQEETFGPLACVSRVANEEDAIALANKHRYGLAASIWTKDVDRAMYLARKIESGNVFINSLVKSDSRVPFGGVKKSGYGRELGTEGIKEFMNSKSIVVG